jgi:hypothetical protein
MTKPSPEEIQRWLKNGTTKWVLEVLAKEVNKIDTIRNITPDNVEEHLAGRLAIEMTENWLREVWHAGELEQFQKEARGEDEKIIKSLKDIQSEY